MILKDDSGVEYELAVVNAFVDNTNTKMNSQLILTPTNCLLPSTGYSVLHDAGNTVGEAPVQDAILSEKSYVTKLENRNLMLEQKVSELEQKIDTILRMDKITKI